MLPAALLVIAIPLLAAGLAYALRRWGSLELLIAIGACGLVVYLLARPIESVVALPGLQVDLDAPLDLLGRALRVRAADRVPLLLLFACAAIVFALSWRAPQGWPFVPVGLLMLAAVSSALMIRPFVFAALALEAAAALAALMIQGERNGERSTLASMRYLITATLALPLLLGADYVIGRAGGVNVADAEAVATAFGPAVILVIAGFALLMGAIPLFTWVHPVAKDAPPMVTTFLVTVGLGAASFLLLAYWQEYDWLSGSETALGALRMGGTALLLFAGLLAWAQRSFSRVLACGILVEIGCMLLLMSTGTQLSVEAIAFSTLARALSLGLLCIGIWRLRELRGSDAFADVRNTRDIWTAMAIGAGGLSFIGLPGTLGFVSRWATARAYSGADAEGLVLLLLAGASVAIGLLRGLIIMFSDVHAHAAAVDKAAEDVATQLSLFDEVDVDVEDAAPLPEERSAGEAVIEGQAVPVNTAGLHLSSVRSRFVIGVGVALVLILGVWPAIIAPLAQAAAAQYGFYR
jgi:multicomponent Na+:H+ antiporter subunit D